MRKILLFALLALSAVVLTMSSCDSRRNNSRFTGQDSVKVNDIVHSAMMPSFTDADAFTDYALAESDYSEFVNIVKSLEPITISSIAFNAIKENKMVDYNGFVREYEKNKNLYDVFDAETKRSQNPTDKPATIEQIVKYKALDKPSDTINVKE